MEQLAAQPSARNPHCDPSPRPQQSPQPQCNRLLVWQVRSGRELAHPPSAGLSLGRVRKAGCWPAPGPPPRTTIPAPAVPLLSSRGTARGEPASSASSRELGRTRMGGPGGYSRLLYSRPGRRAAQHQLLGRSPASYKCDRFCPTINRACVRVSDHGRAAAPYLPERPRSAYPNASNSAPAKPSCAEAWASFFASPRSVSRGCGQ